MAEGLRLKCNRVVLHFVAGQINGGNFKCATVFSLINFIMLFYVNEMDMGVSKGKRMGCKVLYIVKLALTKMNGSLLSIPNAKKERLIRKVARER